MFEHTTKIRVRYGETDQMGYVYYGNYAEFFEVARVEMLRSLGMTYRSMEELPRVKINFVYHLYNEKQELIHVGETLLVFVNMKSNRPCFAPKDFI
ncbi:MAG: acyl-CoA thioesterase, partial [Sphingobacteriales bacterium]